MTISLDQGTRRRSLEHAPVDGKADKNVVLADLLEEVTRRLQSGEPVDWEAFAGAHPEFADELQALLPAVEFLVDWSQGAGSDEGANAVLKCESAAAVGSGPPLGRLGDFRIVREIGRGGMGVVYEAEQTSLNRRVALKVLPFAAIMDPRQLVRFKNEAQAAACLTHQNIVPVYSVGCERGVHYYAMQYVEGESLAQVIQHFRIKEDRGAVGHEQQLGLNDSTEVLPPDQPELRETEKTSAVDATTAQLAALSTAKSTNSPAYFRSIAGLGIQAAEALDHAHKHGILHRDIKPANLMLDTTGNLWITDFGLARFASEASITMTGDLVGTLRYMSPEQALAKRVIVDHRTDIYSLGVTLYELLTLEPIYAGSARQELLRQIAFDEPRPRALTTARYPRSWKLSR